MSTAPDAPDFREADQAPRRKPRSLRVQLLLWVDLVVGLGLFVLIALDYSQELDERISEKRVALEEEAQTLLPAVAGLHALGPDAVQSHVDDVCGRMRETSSPGHHIAVRVGEKVLQARAHHRASSEHFDAMVRAADSASRTSRIGEEEIVVGTAGNAGLRVFVSEELSTVRRGVRARMVRRAAVILGLGLLAALLVNVVLSRLVTRPLKRLVGTVRSIGEGDLGTPGGTYESEEMEILAWEIDAMSSALARAEAARMRELAKARRVQARLSTVPEKVPGLRLEHLYLPAADVAGDYFDVLPLKDGSWLLCIADVSGHGVPAALVAAVLKTLLLSATEEETDPSRILEAVNRRFCKILLPGDFATAALLRWNPDDSSVECGNAGHEAVFLVQPDGRTARLGSTGMILGVKCDESWGTRKQSVEPGARILLYTDGVTETVAPDRSLFGQDRLESLFVELAAEPLNEAVGRIESALATHRKDRDQRDDVTLLLAELIPNSRPPR
ncbi:MAG: PP2C family protein-serine/threonine phosphatase [Planctomycetota bacterium]|jgi:serine phosphatase RsbU (regulator of sigma subunit)